MTPILATFLWLADKFGKDAIESGVQLGWDAARWQRAAGQYADKIERDYGRLPIFGKDRYVPIDEIYTYVHVLDQQDAFFQFAEDKLAQLYVRRNLRYDPEHASGRLAYGGRRRRSLHPGRSGCGQDHLSQDGRHQGRTRRAASPGRQRRRESPSSSRCANMGARNARSTSRSNMS